MRKRLTMALAAGALMAAMVPGVASKAAPGEKPDGGPRFAVAVGCDLRAGGTITAHGDGPAGWAQSQARAALKTFMEEHGLECIPDTKRVSIERVS